MGERRFVTFGDSPEEAIERVKPHEHSEGKSVSWEAREIVMGYVGN